MYSFNLKFNELSEKLLDLIELENIYLKKLLATWPLFVFYFRQ